MKLDPKIKGKAKNILQVENLTRSQKMKQNSYPHNLAGGKKPPKLHIGSGENGHLFQLYSMSAEESLTYAELVLGCR